MVSLRKRPRAEPEPVVEKKPAKAVKPTVSKPPEAPEAVKKLRNNWRFANLCQWIYLFGRAVKIPDEIDVDVLEMECLKHRSTVLLDIGLCLLKYLSSHRGLNYETFDEYTRRQYLSKAPEKNPFGNNPVPLSFQDFDIETRLKVLQEMAQWTMINVDKFRDRMVELNENDHTSWRIEPYGWDSDDRTYFVLDDNRLYRLTDAPPPPPAPSKSKKSRKAQRSGGRCSKRRRIDQSSGVDTEEPEMDDESAETEQQPAKEPIDDGLGGAKWECIAVTYDDIVYFLSTLDKTRDSNEKVLRDQIKEHLLPILEKQEASRKRKEQQRERELESLAKMANAKRSSRLAVKQEQKKMEESALEEERLRRAAEVKARKEEAIRTKLEKERDRRLYARERRMQERSSKKVRHEEELQRLSAQNETAGQRISGRRLESEIEKRKQALMELEAEDDWIFDCICGVHGQVDDGTHSLACEECNVWLHSKCVGVSQEEAEMSDFHFTCSSCQRRAEEKNRPRTMIKIKVGRMAETANSEVTDNKEGSGVNGMQSELDIDGRIDETKVPRQIGAQNVQTQAPKTTEESQPPSRDESLEPTLPPLAPTLLPAQPVMSQAEFMSSPTKKAKTYAIDGAAVAAAINGTSGSSIAAALMAARKQPRLQSQSQSQLQSHVRSSPEPEPRLPPIPATPTRKSNGTTTLHSSASKRYRNGATTPMSRGLPTPRGNNVLAPPSRASMSFEESLNGTLLSSPLIGAAAAPDIPSSPLPPAEAGFSPLKHSSPAPLPIKFGSRKGGAGAGPSIQPPAVLPPLEREVIRTPPVKMTEEQRRMRLSSPPLPMEAVEEEEEED
ncbi:hypothetical protein TD95_003375 [Thielaviopsis punctulata]|uniref:Zinc finger PHD-type domain-containing protein n=1 Tax=Thielaviopsis punctulata TaxID=72032 RepID=A0A0F4ZK67_9PEZI|nr:hypothetical protein TD95_003375 [Thielaviopsis punctulata]